MIAELLVCLCVMLCCL